MTEPPRRQDLPLFLYGTAWKEDETRRLVGMALELGFRGIDTANQRRHYHEAAVGEALREAFASGLLRREELFLQSKFTHRAGQDHRLPYDPSAPTSVQVRQSFASSLEHLGVETLDSYVLHGPTTRHGLGEEDLEAWAAMEALHDEGGVRHLGASNVSAAQLDELCERARVSPAFVQDRCYAEVGWNRDVRAVCRARGVIHQAFSLLTANRWVLAHPETLRIAARHDRSPAQVVFRFALEIGSLPLTGTTDEQHARQDLACADFRLDGDEVAILEALAD